MMESHQFDLMARAQSGAGSRRQGLKLLLGGVIASVLGRSGGEGAAATCRTYGEHCNATHRCCEGHRIACVDGRCRCRQGKHRRDHCTPGPSCQNLDRDPKHCGKCGNACPAGKPCCVNGECRPKCGDTCCADCFVEVLDGNELPNTAVCCDAASGTICGRKKRQRCCWPDEKCLEDGCCSKSGFGTVVCGGECCGSYACCNGQCCPPDKVCAKKPGEKKRSCVSGNRSCGPNKPCFPSETCHGGICCSGSRMCEDLETQAPFCCPAGEYCSPPLGSDEPSRCVPLGDSATTHRGHRVRP